MADKVYSKRRAVEVRPDEYADEVVAKESWSVGVGLGRAYMLGTGRLSLGLAGSARFLIANPADSTNLVTVLALTAFATGTGWATASRNPSGDLPTTARESARMNPHANGGVAPRAVLYADVGTATMTQGTDPVSTVLPANSVRDIGPLGFVLAPGEALGLQSSFGASADVLGLAYITEKPLG